MFDVQLKRVIWWPIRRITGVFHLLPLLTAVVLVQILTRPAQIQEIYLSYVESPDWLQIACAVISFALFSAALTITHYLLGAERIRIVYSLAGGAQHDVGLMHIRRAAAIALAFAPWAGLATGMFLTSYRLGQLHENLELTVLPLVYGSPDVAVRDVIDLIGATSRYSDRIYVAIAVVVIIGSIVAYLLDRGSNSRRSRTLRNMTVGAIALAMIGFAIAAIHESVDLDREIGPLAIMMLALLCFFSIAALLTFLSQETGFPALWVVLVAIATALLFDISVQWIARVLAAVMAVFGAIGLISRRWAVAGLAVVIGALAISVNLREDRIPYLAPAGDTAVANPPALETQLEEWLNARRPPNSDKPYPVFIIAAQGGGIYAAAAASQFLSQLEDRCPGFAEHVLAISGVSGGAIGTAVFQTLAPDKPRLRATECRNPPATPGTLTEHTAAIMQADHFSPIVASIVPDLLVASPGRPRAVAQTFIQSVGNIDQQAAQRLDNEFLGQWSVHSARPALMLNMTWVETGYRVVFTPLTLEESEGAGSEGMVGDGTLHSLSARNMVPQMAKSFKLMEAAVTSARFPGILPPQSVARQNQKREWKRWNFVDGGYADASGAATALHLYRLIDKINKEREKNNKSKLDIDLKVILLTGNKPQQDFSKIDGTAFGDMIAPIDAILKVRGLLASQSVTRACNALAPNGVFPDVCPLLEAPSTDPTWNIMVVELQDELFSLPLGWKLSNTTFKTVSLLLGRRELCSNVATKRPTNVEATTESAKRYEISIAILRNNSCVLDAIEQTLTGR